MNANVTNLTAEEYEVTPEEIQDLDGFVRTIRRLSAGDSDGPNGLATRLSISELGFALKLERVMGVYMEDAQAELSWQLSNCFPKKTA